MFRWPILFVVAVAVVGCDSSRLRWGQAQAAPGDSLGALALDAAGLPRFIPAERSRVVPPDSAACPGTVATAQHAGSTYATWLRVRPDSSVRVMAARRDSTVWTRPAIVDSLDVGRVGCRRPPPSIVVNGDDGYVHIAYSLRAPEGFGVFFAHSMDRALTFHWPMIVVYGDRLVSTAIAAHGMRVAIAYENPSGSARRIDLAWSETQGHTFERRERGSPDEMTATHPRVAIRDTVIALSFGGADTSQRAIRLGYIGQ